MSQDQGWNAPNPPPTPGQAYPPPGQAAYVPAPYQEAYSQPHPQGYAAPPMMQVVPKNAGVALLISFFLPGVGSMYAGKTSTGVIILIGYIVSWVLTVVIIGFVGIFGFWVWGLIDAFQAAQAWNRARGIES
jgi:TM2 domain-containing membrane protein YozV